MAKPITIRGEVIGDSWTDYLSGRIEDAAVAVTAGVRAGTDGLQLQMRQQLLAAGVRPVAGNMIGKQVYPRSGASLGAAGSIFSRGERADLILQAFSLSQEIRPDKRKYLAVPTSFNLVGGRRGGAVRVSAAQMYGMKGMTFVRPIRGGISQYSGGQVWFLRVQLAEQRKETVVTSKTGKQRRYVSTRTLAYAGGLTSGLVGGGRTKRTEDIISGARGVAGAVPMFLLLPLVVRQRKFDPAGLADFWSGQIPDLIARAFPG